MNNRLFLIISCLALLSCSNRDQSNDMMKKAMDVYLFSELDEKSKVDSSLLLTNKALGLNGKNVQALNHRAVLLFRKRDIVGLLETIDTLIGQNPEKPFYLAQKALFSELDGDSIVAREYYQSALGKYEVYLENDSLDFDLWIEYIGVLGASGDTSLAHMKLEKVNTLNFSDTQKEMLELYLEEKPSKETLRKYWNNEVEYDQIQL